jgi:hypothetical protein
MPKPGPARPKSAKPVSSTRKRFKRKRLPPQVPPAPDQHLWHLYRVNRFKTIFWQLPITFLSERDAEMEASWLGSLAVVQGKSYFYIVLDGPGSLYLWLGYDVRVGRLPAHYREPGRKPPGAATRSHTNTGNIMEESDWWTE